MKTTLILTGLIALVAAQTGGKGGKGGAGGKGGEFLPIYVLLQRDSNNFL